MPRLSEKFVFRKPRRDLRHLSVADQSRKRHLRRIYKAVRRHSRKNDFFGKRTPGSPAAKNTTSRGRMSPYTALFRITDYDDDGGRNYRRRRFFTTLRGVFESTIFGGEQSELIARLPASLRMRRAQGEKARRFAAAFQGVRNAATVGQESFYFRRLFRSSPFAKLFIKEKNASFIKGVTKF